MEYIEETDNITKNIVQEIVRECMNINLEIDANFCTYYVKLLTLDPMWKISPERKINRENIQSLVWFIIEKIKLTQSPSLTTMKIQQYFLAHISAKKTIIEHQREILTDSAEPLLDNILQSDCTEANRFRMMKRIVLYIALMSGLGNPKNSNVIKETSQALKSIEEVEDYYEFAAMKPEEKYAYINSTLGIVSGIRLFNRDSGRNVAEIDDLPKMLIQAMAAINSELQSSLQTVMDKVNLTTTALQNIFYVTNMYKKNDKLQTPTKFTVKLSMVKIPGITYEDVVHVIEMLVLCRQHEVYIRSLLAKIQEIEVAAKNLIIDLTNRFAELHNTVKYKIAISTIIVYPLFSDLWFIWKQLQDESFVLSRYAHVFEKTHFFTSNESIDEEKTKLMVGQNNPILTDAQRLEKMQGNKITMFPECVCELFDMSQLEDNIQLEFLGFCIWSFAGTKGGLIPGNPNMGILKWKGLHYSFAFPEAAFVFGKDPDKVILQAYGIIRKKPELINLLKIHDKIYSMRNISILFKEPSILLVNSDKNIQTDLHPIPSHIDPNYVWNIWDYYRQACHLATITGYQTHSMQTIKSNYRYSVPVQTLESRERITQTKQDNSTNVATPLNFIFGLRGRKDDNQHVIELTRPVDEDKYRKCATAMENPPPCMIPKSVVCIKALKKEKKIVSSVSADTTASYSLMQPESVEADKQLLASCICVTALNK